MFNRREFIKKSLLSCAGIMVSGGLLDNGVLAGGMSHPGKRERIPPELWCISDNYELESELSAHAKFHNCQLLFIDDSDITPLYLPGFAWIVDRNLIDEEAWDGYVAWCNEYNINDPVFLIDNLYHLPMPVKHNMSYLDLTQDDSIAEIKRSCLLCNGDMNYRG